MVEYKKFMQPFARRGLAMVIPTLIVVSVISYIIDSGLSLEFS